MHVEFSGVLANYTIFIWDLKLMSVFYSWNIFSLKVGDI